MPAILLLKLSGKLYIDPLLRYAKLILDFFIIILSLGFGECKSLFRGWVVKWLFKDVFRGIHKLII